MQLSAMTLGCPNWTLDEILTNIKSYGFDGVDFRGVQQDLDITTSPLFTTHLAESKRKIQNSGLLVSGISSSISACDPAKLQANLDEAKRTIPLALELGAKNIRIFGNGPVEQIGHEAAAAHGRDCINAILALPGASQLSWNFETHDHWIKSRDCSLLLNTITNPAFGALWDMGHTARIGNETPEQTYAAIGPRIRNVHCKDAAHDTSHPQAMADGWHYALPGQGQLPLEKALHLLAAKNYTGWALFEHEKRWHPDLPNPEIAFPAYINWIKPILAQTS